ncbi:hypothetical protein SLE2022_348670 [Rubroshorea leprosula]
MEITHQNPNPTQTRPDEPELELYTIPGHSSWFSWDDIHETERLALQEFFDGSSISRTPKIYKEYRDFIINKYREDPSRRLTFTDVRKSLISDVTLLHKVFFFLETWGLINFGAPSHGDRLENEERVRFEEGAPNGVRVVATPNLLRPIAPPPVVGNDREVVERGVRLPPLTSYSDVFADLKRLRCGDCGDQYDSEYYEYTKGNFTICAKCFASENFGENRPKDDFKLSDCSENNGRNDAAWTEAETLLLLESVLKHGDDWELVAKNVQTKTRLDCIAKLIELPFGELLLGSTCQRDTSSGSSAITDSMKQVNFLSLEHQENAKTGDQGQGKSHENMHENELNGDTESLEPPPKRKRVASFSDATSCLMNQVALISTLVGPHVTAAAAQATVTALSDETSCPREILGVDDNNIINGLQSQPMCSETGRLHNHEDSEIKKSALTESQETSAKKDVLLPLQIRAAVATGLGAAAAHAKLLAEQEERDIEHLVATVIEAQLKKLHSKVNHVEDLELIMEKEHAAMEELEHYVIGERIGVLEKAFNAGISKWKDLTSLKSQRSNVY